MPPGAEELDHIAKEHGLVARRVQVALGVALTTVARKGLRAWCWLADGSGRCEPPPSSSPPSSLCISPCSCSHSPTSSSIGSTTSSSDDLAISTS